MSSPAMPAAPARPRARAWLAALAVVVALALVCAGQTLADEIAPASPNGALTGQAMGRAGFAYLTGLRQFLAALLWNRLDPQMHAFYGGHVGLGHMVFMLPNIKVITMLDPQFIEAYYVAPEILIQSSSYENLSPAQSRQRLRTALALAKEGVDNNPNSGVLITSYVQFLWADGNDPRTALRYAERAMRPGIVWRWDDEEWDSMAILKDLFLKEGRPDLAAKAEAIRSAISANPNSTSQPQDTGD